MTSDSFMIKRSSPSILTSVPDHLPKSARSHGDDLALLGLLLDSVGNNDAALCLFLSFDAADDDTIVQWTEFHGLRSRFDLRCRPHAKMRRRSAGVLCPSR